MMMERLPFEVSKKDNFFDKLGDWIGDVFYDVLPENGFELRDEQIFMAYQLERAFKEKSVIFAEAGVGTGKTIVYLLYAICYARYIGRPAIIACADESLIEQLVKKEGDIAKLAEFLNLTIDVRLAKSQDQYLCLQKLERAMLDVDFEKAKEIYSSLPEFVYGHAPMQAFYPYGERKDYPHLTDEEWERVACDRFQDISTYEMHNRCGHTLYRDYYRKAKDLIICSHDFYMEHVWTKESRKREGQLPLLPEACCVVFDEGHLLEFAAQKALTYRIREMTLENLLSRLEENDIREDLSYLIEDTLDISQSFFDVLKNTSQKVPGSNRLKITSYEKLRFFAKKLYKNICEIGNELVFESELCTIDQYQLNIVDEYLDQMEYSLSLFIAKTDAITWLEMDNGDYTFVIMPQAVEKVMKEKVFSKQVPFIFSSATLSEDGSFTYLAQSLGIEKYQSFQVASPYNYEEQMKIDMPVFEKNKLIFDQKFSYTMKQLAKTNGRALLLFQSMEDLNEFKQHVKNVSSYHFLFEGDKEISDLISTFQNQEETVLCAMHLWEGLDIPGPSLSNIVIWSLPFPPDDPVFEAKHKTVKDPFWEIDVPYMILRLRQGIGRLIRTKEDRGFVSIFITDDLSEDVKKVILKSLPVSVR